VLGCRPLAGWRIVADPDALDAATWPSGATAIRISPDDVFVIGGAEPVISDPDAIVTPEHGFHAIDLGIEQLAGIAERHIEWALPTTSPALAQGRVAGVPAKLVLEADGTALLLVAAAARHELLDRLGGLT
jgi:hypothetical protein